MVFGDGDGDLFNRFTVAVDVIGHELGHAVTDSTARLAYHDEPGALNESVSDVIGSLVKQRALGQSADQADWLIGAGLFTAKVRGRALRSLLEPGTAYDDPALGRDPQPAHYDDYVQTRDDNGGVHLNSGIPNRAFALASRAAGGPAWEGVGRVWYATLTDDELAATAGFREFARLTVRHAAAQGSALEAAVREGWRSVGVATDPADP
jgi:Zn-dependent metalloprotease